MRTRASRKNRKMKVFYLTLLLGVFLASSAFSQSIPEPKAKIQCSHDGNWYTPDEYHQKCKSRASSGGLKPEQEMQRQMIQGILQPFFNSLFDFSDLLPSPNTSATIEKERQEQLRREQQQKQTALEEWMRTQAEVESARVIEEARKKKEGQEILAKTATTDSGLAPFSWSSPHQSLAPISLRGYETSKLTEVEKLLCAAYFSKLAEKSIEDGNLEGARCYTNQIFNVDGGLPTSIECKPPEELAASISTQNAKALNKKYTHMAKLYDDVMPKIEKLTDIQVKLDELGAKKEEATQKIEELNKKIEELKAKGQVDEKPEKKAEADDLLAQALALKAEAEKQHQEALESEHRLLQEKQNLQKELDAVKAKFQEEQQG